MMAYEKNKCIRYANFLDLVKDRRNVHEFTGKKVAAADLAKMLEAGRWAPSSQNIQPWKFVVVQNKKTIANIMRHLYYGHFYVEPPVLICFVLHRELYAAETHRTVMKGRIGVYEAYLSIAMPVLNMAYEAATLGIGTAMLTPDEKQVGKIIGIRNGDYIPIILAVGYEEENAFKPTRERKPLSELVYYEKFGRKR